MQMVSIRVIAVDTIYSERIEFSCIFVLICAYANIWEIYLKSSYMFVFIFYKYIFLNYIYICFLYICTHTHIHTHTHIYICLFIFIFI